MTDFLTPAERSARMALIRGRNTRPEIIVRRLLHRAGFRFRLHATSLPGRPDIILAKHRTVIFVHGCFWHRHRNCKVASNPKSNQRFWEEKFSKNVLRDKLNTSLLRRLGWKVLVVWECQVGSARKSAVTIEKLADKLLSPPKNEAICPGQKS